jgi:hypothetical protein
VARSPVPALPPGRGDYASSITTDTGK